MSIIHSPSAAKHASSFARTSRQAVATLFIGSVVMLGLSGCGQKGDLYLADSSSQTIEAVRLYWIVLAIHKMQPLPASTMITIKKTAT
ncbi:lipoprotein [Psychrobacter sp. JCM 18900]|uniref:LPS translocon maturation chaperone LptM n=1 Tax=Psychrobacter sp. JCM 18900 TaxID=1298608 RepID=UPI0004353014|nr:lipoprotein [Psychrobacter sp. JCM 18900]GAF51869.1 hypothetical protein JCM18900_353 [Psychrobacter sp. JCM 18900]